MNLLTTLAAFLVALAILVVVHELGHYFAARWCGVRVLRFSFGFGPILASWQARPETTEWVVSAVPLGGYVSMLEQSQPGLTEAERQQTFESRPVLQRMFVVAAGPLANLGLAVLIYWLIYLHGVVVMRAVVNEPPTGTPAAMAGLHAGDRIVRAGRESTPGWDDLNWALMQAAGDREPMVLTLANGETRRISLQNVRMEDESASVSTQLGLQPWEPPLPAEVGEVLPDSVAGQAGLQAGDLVLSLDGQPVASWQSLASEVRASPGKTLHLVVRRQGQQIALSMVPASIQADGKTIGRIGVAPHIDAHLTSSLFETEQYDAGPAFLAALHRTGESIRLNLHAIGSLITGRASLASVSGPLTIADYAGKTARMGVMAFASFLALISVGLGVLNLLPVPILDGGHLLYHMAELVRGAPVSERAVRLGQRVGMAILLTLMAFAFYNDITRILGS